MSDNRSLDDVLERQRAERQRLNEERRQQQEATERARQLFAVFRRVGDCITRQSQDRERGGMTFWVVSDLNATELSDFATHLREREARP